MFRHNGVKVFGIDENMNPYDGAVKAIEALEKFCFNTLGLDSTLTKLGIDETHFRDMAEHACGGEISGLNNFCADDVKKIYKMSW